jgi:hypothetical protein
MILKDVGTSDGYRDIEVDAETLTIVTTMPHRCLYRITVTGGGFLYGEKIMHNGRMNRDTWWFSSDRICEDWFDVLASRLLGEI